MKQILFLASGRGSNFQSFVDHVRLGVLKGASIRALISNHNNTGALEIARGSGIQSFEISGVSGKKFDSIEEKNKARSRYDEECLSISRSLGVDYIILAGFDQILTSTLTDNYPNRILNIHPAYDTRLFGGKNMVGEKVHQSVINHGASYSGCTVHLVTSIVDEGPEIVKKRVDVVQGDDAESLAARILEVEHLAYPEALQLMIDDRVIVSGKQCYVDRFSNNWEMEWMKRQEAYTDLVSRKNEKDH